MNRIQNRNSKGCGFGSTLLVNYWVLWGHVLSLVKTCPLMFAVYLSGLGNSLALHTGFMATLRLEAKNVEGQGCHFHCWHIWEPGFKVGLAVPKCFSLIARLYVLKSRDGREVDAQIHGFAFWKPPTREPVQTVQSGDETVRHSVTQEKSESL